MEIRKVPISLLNAAPYNPRKDLQPGDPEYQKIARSIEKYGCVEPIIWNEKTGNVIGGHQRLKVLAATGAVDTLVFGSECGDTETLKAVAAALESESFAAYLRQGLQEGVSFAAAREAAARKLLGEKAAVLAQPNDILGVEYCKAIARQAAALMPLALPRRGVGHDGGAAEGFASASRIRELLINGACADEFLTPESAAICAAVVAMGTMASTPSAMA